MSFDIIREFHHDSRIHALSWSPNTSLQIVPKALLFAAGGSDYGIRLYSSDLGEKEIMQVIYYFRFSNLK